MRYAVPPGIICCELPIPPHNSGKLRALCLLQRWPALDFGYITAADNSPVNPCVHVHNPFRYLASYLIYVVLIEYYNSRKKF